MTVNLDKIREQRKQGFSSEKATENMNLGALVSDLESITEQMKENYPRISETLFVKNYLLPFCGIGESMQDNYAVYLNWILEIAGSYNVPVHICDDSSKAILFTVPAISNIQTINPAKAKTREVTKAVSMANDARFLQPHHWEAMLQENLFGIYKQVYDSDRILNTDQQVWLDIFKRYEPLLKGKKAFISAEGQANFNKEVKASPSVSYDEVDDPV